MNLGIAKLGNFSLRYKTYLLPHEYTTHDLEIVRWLNGSENCTTVASWENGVLCSVGNRLLNALKDEQDLNDVKHLVDIGNLITQTEKIPIDKK